MTMTAEVGQLVHDDRRYEEFVYRVGASFQTAAAEPLFEVDAPDLWDRFLAGFSPEERQFHNCRTCRAFIERFGNLVTIDADGEKHTAVWLDANADPEFTVSFTMLREAVERLAARVTGVFMTPVDLLGDPQKGRRKTDGTPWSHLHVRMPRNRVYAGTLLNAGQAAAEKAEDMKNVARALAEFPLALLEQATQLLKSDALYRAARVAGPVEWLRNLSAAVDGKKNSRIRENLIWRAVASAPTGFCHPRSSMAGTLLADLEAGAPFEVAAAGFRAKMHPLQYQRPQAAPSTGQIAAAEKMVEQLGIARALERRFARYDEIETLWKPPVEEAVTTGGIFGHLQPKNAPSRLPMETPATGITWVKFAATVLPTARRIEVNAPEYGNYCAFVTALHADAPPILQWDREERRNPVSWYVYHQGSHASQWRLSPGWIPVTGVALRPCHWFGGNFAHLGNDAVFLLPGCVDTMDSGNALFPELLRAELHGARSVIEAYSKAAKIHGREDASAAGLRFDPRHGTVQLRVHGPGGVVAGYLLDRWD